MSDRLRIRKKQARLFYLAMFGPVALWFSYVFVADIIYDHLDLVIWQHLFWMVISAIFCSIWVATEGMLKQFSFGPFFFSLFGFSILQAVLHVIVFYVGCLPAADLMGKS